MSSLREIFFPIYGQKDITKFLLLSSIKFSIIFVLTLTRDTKDSLVVTQCGAEAIAFLKVYGVLPGAILFTAVFAELSNKLSRQPLFYATCTPFLIFFIFFGFVIYPNRHMLEPSMSTIQNMLGSNFTASGGGSEVIAKIINNWTSALFFIVSEVYASASVGILFWKFANDVVSVEQAKLFYPLFPFMSSIAPIVAGQFVILCANQTDNFESYLGMLSAAIGVSGVTMCVLHHIANVFVDRTEDKKGLANENDNDDNNKLDTKKKRRKMSMSESFHFLSASQYLRLVTLLVLSYGILSNFLELSWKSLLKQKYKDPLEYSRFMGNFSSLVGMTTLFVILAGSNIIKLLGWRVGAVTTPVVMSVLAVPYFICIVLVGVDSPVVLNTAIDVGTIMILMSRASKYGLFDPTLQMSYIPLDEESKVKGKAAIDVLASRIGKSGASFFQQGLIIAFGDIITAASAVMMVFYGVSMVWIKGALKLSVLYTAKSKEQQSHAKKE